MALSSAQFSAATMNIGNKIALPDFCSKLKELGLPSSNSWSKTIGKLQDIIDSTSPSPTDVASLETLVEWIAVYLCSFSKAVRIYELGNCSSASFLVVGRNFTIGLHKSGVESGYPSGEFPALAGKADCGLLISRYFLRHVTLSPTTVSVVITTVAEYYIRENINVTVADSAAVSKLSGYSEIIGIRKVAYEHVDVIRVSHGVTGPDVLSVDILLDVSRPGDAVLNQEEIIKRFNNYHSMVTFAMNSAMSGGSPLPQPLNFFPAMEKIYNSTDGNVCELGFATTLGGSVKREKMKRNTADLRVETWHAGGRKAIASAAIPDTIDIYRLSVSWKISMSDDQPILSVPGTYKALSTGDVRHALILGCTEMASFDFAFSRLLAYVK
ncbi:hypothetical protein [Pseudomonas sp. Z4-20]|uniref:hypothetical protein n=1 Tax=Pseudomonas sp. Z4-20 TaxID=2817414 RepID=UPI003DA7B731